MIEMEEAPARGSLGSPRARTLARRRSALFVAIAVLVVAADQFTKWLIRQTVEPGSAWPGDWPVKLVHITNSGAAFGMLQGAGPLLAVTSVIGMAAIVMYLFNPDFAHPLMQAGLALMFGGAVGNLIDRVWSGEVVDFIKFPYFWTFNVADSSITIGVVLLAWAIVMEGEKKSNAESL